MEGLNLKQLQNKIKSFISQINVNFDQCFRCGACSGICPVKKVSKIFDPRIVIHLLLNGFYERVLNEVLWFCSQCGSCVPVCPMDVKPREVIGALRRFMIENKLISEDKLFEVGAFARVKPEKCIVCLTCVRVCPFSAPKINKEGYAVIQIDKCKACGICVKECPAQAIELRPKPEFWEYKLNGEKNEISSSLL